MKYQLHKSERIARRIAYIAVLALVLVSIAAYARLS